jgi:hypothetical protein
MKCTVINIGNHVCRRIFSIGQHELTSVSEARDLGVIVDMALKFDAFVNNIVAKARSRASLIHKCFISKSRQLFMSVPCWSMPHLLGHPA